MDTIIRQAIDLANAGHKEQALQLFREAARRDPSQAAALKWIAHLTTDPREAYAAIQRVLHLDPGDRWAQEYAARLQAWMRQQQAQPPPAAVQHTAAQHPARRSSRGSVLGILVTAIVLVLAGGAVLLALVLGPRLGIGDQNGPVIPDQVQADGAAAIVPGTVDELLGAGGLVTSTPVPTVYVTDIPTPTPQPPTAAQEPTQQPAEETQPEPAAQPTDSLPAEMSAVSDVPILYDPQTTYYTFEAETIPQIQDALLLYGPGDVGAEDSHAIATTTYDMGITWKTVEIGGACRLIEASITLNLIYLYPQWNPAGSPTQEVYDEWDRFMAHIVDHEEHHADIAYGCAEELAEMVVSADISGPCRSVGAQMNALAGQMYQSCDQQQMAFDAVEGHTTFPLP